MAQFFCKFSSKSWDIKPLKVLKYSHEYLNGGITYATSFLDFKFDFVMPSPRKWRIITERDEKGRIVHSRPTTLI